jgi:hypothetical protein
VSEQTENPEPETPYQRDGKLIESAIKTLSEHFTNIQVFATRYENEEAGTLHWIKGHGDIWAREGIVKDWLVKQDEFTRHMARRTLEEPEE